MITEYYSEGFFSRRISREEYLREQLSACKREVVGAGIGLFVGGMGIAELVLDPSHHSRLTGPAILGTFLGIGFGLGYAANVVQTRLPALKREFGLT